MSPQDWEREFSTRLLKFGLTDIVLGARMLEEVMVFMKEMVFGARWRLATDRFQPIKERV